MKGQSSLLLLWFDVEEGYNTTESDLKGQELELWFDVEEGYNTTIINQCR